MFSTVSPPDVLVALPIPESPLQLQILTLCEAWWKKDLKEKETFALTALLVALKKCFTLKKMVGASVPRQIGVFFFSPHFMNFPFAARLPRSSECGIFTTCF